MAKCAVFFCMDTSWQRDYFKNKNNFQTADQRRHTPIKTTKMPIKTWWRSSFSVKRKNYRATKSSKRASSTISCRESRACWKSDICPIGIFLEPLHFQMSDLMFKIKSKTWKHRPILSAVKSWPPGRVIVMFLQRSSFEEKIWNFILFFCLQDAF